MSLTVVILHVQMCLYFVKCKTFSLADFSSVNPATHTFSILSLSLSFLLSLSQKLVRVLVYFFTFQTRCSLPCRCFWYPWQHTWFSARLLRWKCLRENAEINRKWTSKPIWCKYRYFQQTYQYKQPQWIFVL